MRCSTCSFDNPHGMKFCTECGAPLKRYCLQCRFENLPNAKFCGECGTSLTGLAPVPLTISPEAERRQLTVMFCDLVGSTSLSQRLDPEDLREVLHAYQEVCEHVIRRYDGHIAKFLGDGVLVYFGYPQAHEDDPQRAVRAGLGIIEGMERLNPRLQKEQNVRLAVRLGVHTGLVVVGEMGSGESREANAIVGESTNIAARLQGIAAPDTLVVSEATFRLVQGYFATQPLDRQTLKGLAQPLAVYRVLRESGARTRLEVAAGAGLTPFVGRKQELGLLLESWERARDGAGQVVVVSGEAGIGKSRLVQMVKEYVAQDPEAWLTPCQCSPYHQHSALYPMIELLQTLTLQFEQTDTPEQKLGKVEGFLVQHGFPLADAVPLLATLLSIPLDERYAPLSLAPEQQKRQTLELLVAVLLQRAAQQPLLFVVEDLHWIDPSTLELLTLLIDQVATASILALFTCRPDFTPPWDGRAQRIGEAQTSVGEAQARVGHAQTPVGHVSLNRLNRRQVGELVDQMVHGKTLPAEVLQQVVDRTDGVPLFVEELTKMVLESGLLRELDDHFELTGPLPPLAIPATLHDSLMARLDRLAAVKEVAQLAATLGREFSYELLRAVSTADEAALQAGLAHLVEAELLYQQGTPPQASYTFKHALIQDAAYQSLLKSRRQIYHQRIAQVLIERFPEVTEAQPELVAQHYTEAGLAAQAIPYWQRAGERAAQRSANLEAIGMLQRGLALVEKLADTPARAAQELALLLPLSLALQSTLGWGTTEVEQVLNRAQVLCQQLGAREQLHQALHGFYMMYHVRGEERRAFELAQQLLAVAEELRQPALLVEAYQHVGSTSDLLGRLELAREHFNKALALYDSSQHAAQVALGNYDVNVTSLTHAAHVLWQQGYPDQALCTAAEGVERAQVLSHPFSQAYALAYTAMLHQWRGDSQVLQERIAAGIELCTRHDFQYYLRWCHILQAWTKAKARPSGEDIERLRQCITAFQANRSRLRLPYYYGLLAERQGAAGDFEAGLSQVAAALEIGQQTGEVWWDAELHRLKGELLLASPRKDSIVNLAKPGSREIKIGARMPAAKRPLTWNRSRRMDSEEHQAEAQACFEQAIEIARGQGARSLELRAATSLSRLWQQQGKCEAARQMLGEVYGWFTEGFDTADLQAAKALLETLSTC
ncbi:MAG: adenylate/guanylate cyclase domain-containing protein [Chloroflexi bacterium]|nr:adenylate/guanylate cyclase domain-containing protein [Chloroflexota bacterium]